MSKAKYKDLTPEQLIEALEAKDGIIEAKDEALKTQSIEATELIADLSGKLEKVEAFIPHSVKLGKESYTVAISKFKFDGEEIDGKTLTDDSDMVKELVAMGSGVLVKK